MVLVSFQSPFHLICYAIFHIVDHFLFLETLNSASGISHSSGSLPHWPVPPVSSAGPSLSHQPPDVRASQGWLLGHLHFLHYSCSDFTHFMILNIMSKADSSSLNSRLRSLPYLFTDLQVHIHKFLLSISMVVSNTFLCLIRTHDCYSNVLCCQSSLFQLMITGTSNFLKPKSLQLPLNSCFFSYFISSISNSFLLCL